MIEIRGAIELPAQREEIELVTSDGLTLVGELALPLNKAPVATLLCLHPLPIAGGFMDSHILRKVAARLPYLADIAVLRFNFRGTSSPRGKSEGSFDDGIGEGKDFAAAVQFIKDRQLPLPWVVGWSFGTEVALKWGLDHELAGVILLSPPVHRTTSAELAAWQVFEKPLIAMVPEHDDFLKPASAREVFKVIPNLEQIDVPEAKHLWVGEKQSYRVLNELAARLNPKAVPLPTELAEI